MATKERMFAFAYDGTVLQVQRFSDKAVLAKFDLDPIPESIQRKLTQYGFKQKLADSASDSKTPAAKLDDMEEIYRRMMDGEFALAREGGTRTTPLWILALAELKKASVTAVQKALANYSDEQKAKIRERDDIKAIVERLEAEAADVDLDDMTE